MPKTNKTLWTLLAAGLTWAALSAGINPTGAPEAKSAEELAAQEMLIADSLERARQDSIEIAVTQELNDAAARTYKELKTMQYDGVTEAELYPKVMQTRQSIIEAMKAPRATEEDLARHRKTLRDLGTQLINGALYYSNTQDNKNFVECAKAYVDMRMSPEFKDMTFPESDSRVYPVLIYNTASLAYNAKDYSKAADYMKAYLSTGDKDYRQYVLNYLGQAALNSKRSSEFAHTLLLGAAEYPADLTLQKFAIQNCVAAGEFDLAGPAVEKALLLQPEDENLIWMKGLLLEGDSQFADALSCFEKLVELKPTSMTYNKHLAQNYFNLGVEYYNRSINESDEKKLKRYARQSNAYFTTACERLAEIVHNEPTNVKYLQALAYTHASLGHKEQLDEINTHLGALGQSPVKLNDMPPIIASAQSGSGSSFREVPDFQSFALKEIKEFDNWRTRGEFETTEKFNERVNEKTAMAKERELSKQAEQRYIDTYARNFRITDMKLHDYDPDHGTYRITSSLGEFVLQVPNKGGEAERFRSQWDGIQVSNPKYFIDNNKVAIASITLKVPGGKSYTYNSEKAPQYDFTRLRYYAGTDEPKEKGTEIVYPKTDVDMNLPTTTAMMPKTLALIIANENYTNVSKVNFALNDGKVMREYFNKVLGIPAENIIFCADGTQGELNSAVYNLQQRAKSLGDGVELMVYYAGHGFPDEDSKDAYLLPVDGSATSLASAYSLKKFYSDLTATGADNVMVFIDACFSGITRDSKPLVEGRSVELASRPVVPEGNMYVLSATSDKQTALPYKDKYHGLFTYFLLQKLKQTKGKVSLKELSDYMSKEVPAQSLKINQKIQTPRTTVSGTLRDTWADKKLRK